MRKPIVEKHDGSFTSLTGVQAGFARKRLGRVSYEIDHETNPPPGAVGTDRLTCVTMVYDF